MVAWLIHTLQTLIGDFFSFSALTYANLEKILNNNQVIRIVFYKKKKRWLEWVIFLNFVLGTGIEPILQDWESWVLTVIRTQHVSFRPENLNFHRLFSFGIAKVDIFSLTPNFSGKIFDFFCNLISRIRRIPPAGGRKTQLNGSIAEAVPWRAKSLSMWIR